MTIEFKLDETKELIVDNHPNGIILYRGKKNEKQRMLKISLHNNQLFLDIIHGKAILTYSEQDAIDMLNIFYELGDVL